MENKTLIVMRHAKSDWQDELISDFDRPLNNRGLNDAPRMAKWMASENLIPDLLICSPALRARQTAEEIIKHLRLPESSINYDRRLYLASTETLLTVIGEIEYNCNTAMLIGHNPGLENLVIRLCKGEIPVEADNSLMTTANIFQIRLTSTWNNISLQNNEIIRVKRPRQFP